MNPPAQQGDTAPRRGLWTCTVDGRRRYFDPFEKYKALIRHSHGQLWQWINTYNRIEQQIFSSTAMSSPVGGPEGWQKDPLPDIATNAHLHEELQHAQESIVAVTRMAFGLPTIDETTGQGVMAEEVWAIFYEFMVWTDDQKKNSATLATSTGLSEDCPPASTPSSNSESVPMSEVSRYSVSGSTWRG